MVFLSHLYANCLGKSRFSKFRRQGVNFRVWGRKESLLIQAWRLPYDEAYSGVLANVGMETYNIYCLLILT